MSPTSSATWFKPTARAFFVSAICALLAVLMDVGRPEQHCKLSARHVPKSGSGQNAHSHTDYACPPVRSKATGNNGMAYYLVDATNRLRALGLVTERGRLGRRGVNKAPPARR